MAPHIFLYGTMLPRLARGYSARLAAALGTGRSASITGRLHAVITPAGCYPVLIRSGEGSVAGEVYALPAAPDWLAALDHYENYDPANEPASEYLRREVEAVLADGTIIPVQTYIGRESSSVDLVPIGHGDFPRFLAETGLRPYEA
jgi:gamma-glutamylcyclotransferase (GGCT)/AIG2-like uncharacterized protein YtfP